MQCGNRDAILPFFDGVRESQIERGWLAHEPERGRIPREVWRKRTFKRTIAPIADRLDIASTDNDRLKVLLYDYVRLAVPEHSPSCASILTWPTSRSLAVASCGLGWRRAGAC